MIRCSRTYLAIVVEVGVEAHAVSTGGLQVDQRGGVGVVLGEVDVKLKAAVGVWSVRRARDEDLEWEKFELEGGFTPFATQSGKKR